jgi:tRNA dimethylallyltransferase
MAHTRIIDERCEQMITRGLINETTTLSLAGCLPEMAERAIGYRQTLNYLHRERKDDETEEDIFDDYLNEFTTATRRYAKKQMSWFRKDDSFIFIPVQHKLSKVDRVDSVGKEIENYCQLSHTEYEKELRREDSKSADRKRENELQGKTMKFYQFERHILIPGSKQYTDALAEGIECRQRIRSGKNKKRSLEETSSI